MGHTPNRKPSHLPTTPNPNPNPNVETLNPNPNPNVETLNPNPNLNPQVVAGAYNGVKTLELDNLMAETAAYLATDHPDYRSNPKP